MYIYICIYIYIYIYIPPPTRARRGRRARSTWPPRRACPSRPNTITTTTTTTAATTTTTTTGHFNNKHNNDNHNAHHNIHADQLSDRPELGLLESPQGGRRPPFCSIIGCSYFVSVYCWYFRLLCLLFMCYCHVTRCLVFFCGPATSARSGG